MTEWQKYQAAKKAQLDAEGKAFQQSQAESAANIARLKAEKAEIERTIVRLRERLGIKNEPVLANPSPTTDLDNGAASEKGLDKLLYLPKGHLRSYYPPENEIVVTAATAELLNAFARTIFARGDRPFLDLAHDGVTRTFDPIVKFVFEDTGVMVLGRYTAIGRQLKDAGRITGLSATFQLGDDAKPLCSAFGTQPIDWQSGDSASVKFGGNIACMGGILIDGAFSAMRPVKPAPAPGEEWRRILKQMPAVQVSPESTTE